MDPFLQPLHGFTVSALDLAFDGREVRRSREARQNKGSSTSDAAAEERAPGEGFHAVPSARLGATVKRCLHAIEESATTGK